MPAKTKIIALLCAALGMGMLSGCAMHPDWVKPGQEEASVVNQIGVPDSRIEYPVVLPWFIPVNPLDLKPIGCTLIKTVVSSAKKEP